MNQTTLFPKTEPEGEFVLWHRPPVKGARWRKVGAGRTHYEAVLLMSGSGEYMVKERGGHPNDERGARVRPKG